MGATRTVIPAAREGTPGNGTEVRLLVVEFLDASGVVGADEAAGAAKVPCARGWCGGDWSVAFPADVLVRDLGVSKAALVRNGWFLVRGQQLGRWFVVQRVLRRAPITAPDGAVLVSSWPPGATAPARRWVPPEGAPKPWPARDPGEALEEPALLRKRRRQRRPEAGG